jgi:hypothetical protein
MSFRLDFKPFPVYLKGKRKHLGMGRQEWRLAMIRKTVCLTILFLSSSLLWGPTWGQLVDKVDLVRPIPVPVQGTVEVEGNVNVVNAPEVIVREIPEVVVTGNVNVMNAPEVRVVDVVEVEVANEAGRGIPVRIVNPEALRAQEDPGNFFSWHRRSSIDAKTQTRTHSAISVSRMAGRTFVLTDLVVTSRFGAPDTQMIVTLNGAGADRGLGLEFILVSGAPHLVSHFQTGILFSPDIAIDVSVSGSRDSGAFEVDYAITFSGYFLTQG